MPLQSLEKSISMSDHYDYDVAIIGAGMGGLACGCYLAQAGLKTVIVEKNSTPGGYCASFTKNGFHFDTYVHSLGSCRRGGTISNILEDLNLRNKIKFLRCNHPDTIITPDYKISFGPDLEQTIRNFSRNFFKESNSIEKFFKKVVDADASFLMHWRDKTFGNFLDYYFTDERLKAILSFPILGNAGMPASRISAFYGIKLYSEFMVDGGYYPEGGMQSLPKTLAARFHELKGELLLSKQVIGIKIEKDLASKIVLSDNKTISAKYFVSNVDAQQTFSKLLRKDTVNGDFLNKLSHMQPSLSMFIVHLGIEETVDVPPPGSNHWQLPFYDIDEMFSRAQKRSAENLAEFMVHICTKKSVSIFINSNFHGKEYWDSNRNIISEALINKAEQVIPGVSRKIIFKQTITPYALFATTLNRQGAAYGWEGTPSQIATGGLTLKTCIKNLFLTGHWTTLAQGVGGVLYLGSETAKLIIRRAGLRKK